MSDLRGVDGFRRGRLMTWLATLLLVSGAAHAVTLVSLTLNPTGVTGGDPSTGTVTLDGMAPQGGAVVSLGTDNDYASVPQNVTVLQGVTSATFPISTVPVPGCPGPGPTQAQSVNIIASYAGATRSATLYVGPASPGLRLNPATVARGSDSVGTVTLTNTAGSGGIAVTLSSSDSLLARVPASVTVPTGSCSAIFTIKTDPNGQNLTATITATYVGVGGPRGRPTPVTVTAVLSVPPFSPVRGVAGDRWADVILGKPGFSEITPNQVSRNRIFNSGGTVVDRTVQPNRIYVYDAGNSRVLGMSHLGVCAGGIKVGQNCTANSDCPGSTCAVQSGIGADLVLGQPNFTTSACNGDGNFQTYPARQPASASTLCGLPEDQVSPLEGGSFANMAVDSAGNLYVPDWDNNRIVRFNSPFTTDTTADYVWGQAGFSGNQCNRGRGFSLPDAQSLCFRNIYNEGFTGGTAVDASGNLWVTDNSNNRVLRFPRDPATGIPRPSADLVLGQPDFNSSSKGSALNQMWSPAAVRVDAAGTVYVADSQPDGGNTGGRVLVFRPPFSNGMSASSTLGAGQLRTPSGLELDPGGGLWVNDSVNNQLLLYVGGVVQKVLFKDVPDFNLDCGGPYVGDGPRLCFPNGECFDSSNVCGAYGGIGVDGDGNVVVAISSSYQDMWHFAVPFPAPVAGMAHSADKSLFLPYRLGDHNQVGPSGIYSGRGVAVAANQLVVADITRILFWNNPPNFSNGQIADGEVGSPDFLGGNYDNAFGRLSSDGASHLWALHGNKIEAYSLPLTTRANPIVTLASPLPLLGGGTIAWQDLLGGIASNPAGTRVWIADADRSRVFRIRNPLTNPVVDVILGQLDATHTDCNFGQGQLSPSRNSLCWAGAATLDPAGNLYVADDSLEVRGNYRLLEFDAGLFPDSPAAPIFGTAASRVFGTAGSFTDTGCQGYPPTDPLCAPFEPAFDSAGHMVVGTNGYGTSRFPLVYFNPLMNQIPDTYLNDFDSMGYQAKFDSQNNLYIVDLNRNRVLIYRNPFSLP